MSCNICIEPYNKTSRAKVVCRCSFEACRACIKTYFLDRSEDASCMSCKIGWDRGFLSQNLEGTFMSKDYKIHRENLLIEREMGMLQATQPYVEREIKMERLKLEIEELRIKYHRDLQILEDEYASISISSTVERKKFIRKCPNGYCHGFLSSGLKCELCENFACSNCREVTGKTTMQRDAHVCNPQIVESVKFLEKDSKPCPNCASLTFKIHGCHSMWCVECHSSWNWVSGKIENGAIHNPEYFDWLKNKTGTVPRNPLDIVCGREIDNNFVSNLIGTYPIKLARHWVATVDMRGRPLYYNRQTNQRTSICPYKDGIKPDNNFGEIARNIIHIRHVEVARFQAPDRLQDNLQMRIDFMRNKIEKEDFKKRIQKKEKDNDKKREINNVLGMYINCMTDIFYRLINNPKEKDNIKNEMEELRKYVNESFKRISTTFNCKAYEINKDFVFC